MKCQGFLGPCDNENATEQPTLTAYADPAENVKPVLCPWCAEDYKEHWENMWAEYHSSQGCV